MKGKPMSHTYTKLLFHCVFSTKDRRPLLKGDLSGKIDAYLAGIARNHNMHLVRSGGTADHRHLLLELKPVTSVAEAMRIMKTNSSKWLGETCPQLRGWGWQEGYSAFSVSLSACGKVVAYIDGQEEHHKTMTFEEELVALLKRHGVEFDLDDVLR